MKFAKYKPKKMNLLDKRFNICEPLSATGLRAIRYYLELNNNKIGEIVASDMDQKAEDMMQKNTKHNNIDTNTENSRFKIHCSEATRLLYSHPNHFDIIDLDPYGTAIPLLDSAIHALPSGGFLCVTFTDMPVLCGNYQETCYYKYSSISAKKPYCHEVHRF
jgi:tRNA (guanine26-N2/guanine27-N2)-dimethyltransferase